MTDPTSPRARRLGGLSHRLRRALSIAGVCACIGAPLAAQPAPTGDIIAPGPGGPFVSPPTGDILDTSTETLFDAVNANDFATVQNAVAAGADIDAINRWGLSPIDIAIDKGYFEIAHFLLSVRNFRPAQVGGPALGPRGDARSPAAGPAIAPRTAAPPAVAGPAIATRTSAEPPPPAPAPQATRPAPQSASADPPADPTAYLPPAQIEPQEEPPLYVWPSDEPNPFDPSTPVVGSTVPSTR